MKAIILDDQGNEIRRINSRCIITIFDEDDDIVVRKDQSDEYTVEAKKEYFLYLKAMYFEALNEIQELPKFITEENNEKTD